MLYLEKTNNDIIYNQMKIKLLYKSSLNYKTTKFINLNLNLFNLKSFDDVKLIEGFYLLEFFTGLKPYINSYKKHFNNVYVQLSTTLRDNFVLEFLLILSLFYFPIYIRRNLTFIKSKKNFKNFYYSLNNINSSFILIPDIYFR